MTAKYHGNFKARVCCQGGTAGNRRKSNGWQKREKPFSERLSPMLLNVNSKEVIDFNIDVTTKEDMSDHRVSENK